MNIYGPPSCSREAFSAHLRDTGSPAAPEADAIFTMFAAIGIDAAVALAFFHHESNCATDPRARAIKTKSWGNIRWKPIYVGLPYFAVDLDGFAAYQTFLDGAKHFRDHLLGLDGTNNYAGLTTVEEVVPIWAPAGDSNSPPDYIAAVEKFVGEIRGATMTKPKVLLCAGHVNIENITSERIGVESRDILKHSTGPQGERDWNGWLVGMLMDALNATGLVDASANDAIYSLGVYRDWLPDVILWSHFHRDRVEERAIFSAPDPAVFGSRLDCEASVRLKEAFLARYTQATGIPVTEQFENLNTTQFYGYWYPEPNAAVLLAEWGNDQDGLDHVALWDQAQAAKIITCARDSILAFLGLTVTPPPPEPPAPPEPPTTRTKAVIIAEIRSRLEELETLP